MKTTFAKKSRAILMSCIFITFGLTAQEKTTYGDNVYKNAIGLRFGETSGLTFKHKFDQQNALEFIIGTHPYSYGITGLYEFYIPTKAKGLNIYVGAGGHIAQSYSRVWRYNYYDGNRYYYYRTYGNGPIFGIDAITGLEYKIPSIPLAFSLDIKPCAEFFPDYGTYFRLDPGLGIKIAF